MPRFAHPLLFSVAALSLVCAPARAGDKPRKPLPAADAKTYALRDSHDGITIAADPGDLKETRPNTRLDYFHHGFLPIRVIVTNDTAQPLSLDDTRILFVSSDNYTENAATDDDLERRMFSKKYNDGTKIPLPAPLPSITIHHPGIDKLITEDQTDFGFPSTTVAPHSTVAGYLFYDTRDINDPILEHATLELRKVRWASTNKELQAFDIALKPSTAKPEPATSLTSKP